MPIYEVEINHKGESCKSGEGTILCQVFADDYEAFIKSAEVHDPKWDEWYDCFIQLRSRPSIVDNVIDYAQQMHKYAKESF